MYICMYLCMYVCMYSCMYVCMHTCIMYACMYVFFNLLASVTKLGENAEPAAKMTKSSPAHP